MPFALAIIGVVLLVASVRNTQSDLYTLVKGDFTGKNNFIYWTLAILFIGSFGYVPKLKPISVGFLTLVVIVLILARGNPDPTKIGGGFFQKFMDAIGGTQSTVNTLPVKDNNAAVRSPLPSIFDNLSSLIN